jgi:hypothetical protein
MGDGSMPGGIGSNIPWVRIADASSRTTGNETAGFTEIETAGEIQCVDHEGQPFAPEHIIVNGHVFSFRTGQDGAPASHDDTSGFLFRSLADKVDLYVEAVVDASLYPVFRSPGILPEGSCQAGSEVYDQQLIGCGTGQLTWTMVSGSLPAGIEMSSDGHIYGRTTEAGTYPFTILLEDDVSSRTKDFELTIAGPCCNYPSVDQDGDGDVDQSDFAAIQLCYTDSGDPNLAFDPEMCHCFDLDLDLDIDSADLETFEACASGPGIPAVPSCADPT